MSMTPIDLHDVALTLENEREFHDKYKARAPDLCHGGRRDLIGTLVGKLIPYRGQSPRTTAEDREQLRRYFDDTYNMPCTVVHKAGGVYSDMSGIPDIEFWLDEVKYPNTQPWGLSEGAKFDVVFSNGVEINDRGHWTRFGRPWNSDEVAHLKGLFWSGRNLEYICRAMERPPNGVLNKLVELRFLHYNTTVAEYTVTKKTPANSRIDKIEVEPDPDPVNRDAEPTTSPTESAEHTDSAISHLTAVSNSLKEILMNKTEIITIETKTLINGVDITTFKDSEIYSLIAAQEAEIETLDKIKTKPKKLVAEIEKRKAGIEALVAYLDSKE